MILDNIRQWIDKYTLSEEEKERRREVRKALRGEGKYGWQPCDKPEWVDPMKLGPNPKYSYGDSWIYKGYLADAPGKHGPRWLKQLRYREWPDHVQEKVNVHNERR